MKHLTKFLALGAFCTLLAGLTSCNEEPEYATTILKESKSDITLYVGDSYSLVVDAAETNDLTWASDKEDIVSVENGVLTAKKPGKATITATNAANQTALTAKVIVRSGYFKLYEDKNLLFTMPLDSCIDFYFFDENTIIHECVLFHRSNTLSDDSWDWNGEEEGIYVEFGFRSDVEHNGEYIAPEAGTYDLDLGNWYFDYKCFFVEGTELYQSTWDTEWYDLFQSYEEDLTIKIEKKGNIYTVKRKGTDVRGYNFEFYYSGPMLNYQY